MYATKGIIVSKPPNKDITMEKAEEDAIIAGAEEIEEMQSANKEDRVFQASYHAISFWGFVSCNFNALPLFSSSSLSERIYGRLLMA